MNPIFVRLLILLAVVCSTHSFRVQMYEDADCKIVTHRFIPNVLDFPDKNVSTPGYVTFNFTASYHSSGPQTIFATLSCFPHIFRFRNEDGPSYYLQVSSRINGDVACTRTVCAQPGINNTACFSAIECGPTEDVNSAYSRASFGFVFLWIVVATLLL